MGCIRGPPGAVGAADRRRPRAGGRRVRQRRLRLALAGRVRRPGQRGVARAGAGAGHLRQPGRGRRRHLLQRRPDRRRAGVPVRRRGRRRPDPRGHDLLGDDLLRHPEPRHGQRGRPLRPGADLPGRRQPGRPARQLGRGRADPRGGRARDRRGRRVRRVRRRQRDHLRGPRPRREDLAADRRAAGAPHLRQPRRRRDARSGRRPRRGRVPRGGADDHRLHRGLDLLRQRDHPARDGSRDRLLPLHDQQVPRGAGEVSGRRPATPRPRPSCRR